MRTIGADPYTLLHSLCLPVSPAQNAYEELTALLDTHYTSPTIVFRERKCFHMATRGSDETVTQWFATVKRLAMQCKFADKLDDFVKDKFVVGLPDKIFERICEDDSTISLNDVLKKALTCQMKFSGTANHDYNNDSVNYVGKRRNMRWTKTWSETTTNPRVNRMGRTKRAIIVAGVTTHHIPANLRTNLAIPVVKLGIEHQFVSMKIRKMSILLNQKIVKIILIHLIFLYLASKTTNHLTISLHQLKLMACIWRIVTAIQAHHVICFQGFCSIS